MARTRTVFPHPVRRVGRAAFGAGALCTLYGVGGLVALLTAGVEMLPAVGVSSAGALVAAWILSRWVQARELSRRRAALRSAQRASDALAREAATARRDGAQSSGAPAEPTSSPPADPDQLREMRWSREIQAALLPQETPRVSGYHFEVRYLPCGDLGGDFYDFRAFEDGRWLVTLGDVAGKGPAGAIVMAMIQTLFRQNAAVAAGPADLLCRVNDGFAGTLGKGIFATCLVGILEPATHTLHLAGAGHHPVLLLNPRSRRSTAIHAKGPALGIMSGSGFDEALVETTIDLECGDSLLLYTDGATEGVDTLVSGTGENRLRAAAAAAVLEGQEGSLVRIEEELWSETPRRDDTTLLLLGRGDGPREPVERTESAKRESGKITA